MKDYVIGVDYGTSSVRSIVVDARSGEELASAEFEYPRFKKGLYIDASNNRFRQHPKDYIEGLEHTIKEALAKLGDEVRQNVKSISIDTTGSTPVAVDEKGVPLALKPEFAENPNAMFVLWKDHTSVKEADEINEHATKFDVNYLQYVGGIYSSEWFWAKLLHVLREDEAVRAACYSWVEHCDWMPFLLTGGTDPKSMKRSVCAAGHKGLWAEEFGGLPPEEFFSSLDPLLSGFRERLFEKAYPSDESAGELCEEWSQKLGLPSGIKIGVGALDAHMGAVGGQIEPFYLSKVMGTSTCDMIAVPPGDIDDTLVKGICGQVDGSIIPGMIGLEAGQSAFGDVYAWFEKLISWPLKNFVATHGELTDEQAKLISEIESGIIAKLSKDAAEIPLSEDLELSEDWFNGRRTPDANPLLKGAITGLNLGSDAPRVFRSLAEATCFGAKKIVDRFTEEGIPIKGVIAVGGVARKSEFVLQMMSDVLGMPIKVHRSDQTCALGASMFAAAVADIYPTVEDAMKVIGGGFDKHFEPNEDATKIYHSRYKKYLELCDFIESKSA